MPRYVKLSSIEFLSFKVCCFFCLFFLNEIRNTTVTSFCRYGFQTGELNGVDSKGLISYKVRGH